MKKLATFQNKFLIQLINRYKRIYLLIFINLIFSIIAKNRKLVPQNKIIIKINGTGTQNILYEEFEYPPSQILINGYPGVIEEGNTINNLELIENNITMIWDEKLQDCTDMFSELTNLTEVDLSNFDTSEVVSMHNMFFDCINLKSINLNNIVTSSLQNLGSTFYSCQSLLFLDLSSFNTSLVTNIASIFFNCESLTSIILGNFDTSNVELMSFSFFFCSSLKSIDLSNFNTSLVTNMNYMFAGCSSLKTINIANFNTTKVSFMDGFFSSCINLEYINMSNFIEGDSITITNITNMFYDVPNNLTYCVQNSENIPLIKEELRDKNYKNKKK